MVWHDFPNFLSDFWCVSPVLATAVPSGSHEKITHSNRQINYKSPFSIAMLNYQRVSSKGCLHFFNRNLLRVVSSKCQALWRCLATSHSGLMLPFIEPQDAAAGVRIYGHVSKLG